MQGNDSNSDKLWGEIFSEIDVTQMTSNLELTVMNGDLDFSIAPLEEWTNIESAFRSLKLIELKGVSHTPMLENPQQFCRHDAQYSQTEKLKGQTLLRCGVDAGFVEWL
ncbi:alpha/beta fold hydrolase [Vibrio brasiliensis]|uniref:Alpha/beta hydrolase fold protein n=1 Tax=Vibrio brasiliensis LMG 20546 TaxID=945543 RepID=E8LZ64_9VIBR|nr:hypothetical protein [Vibrio brasiliensis]EGA64050.1 alpha/beta hydrolase fold protein [Vibrio brasiliensis LMG 20546]